ncbi:SAG-related sequence [Besnoitia besnoiti]|uniref:SAG-related sequence n=1 Tax=Besnoitia besnoiti TaxID=94643 RepID=A0A2A9MN58_BESBE|nr:SAG-related sequence [Besnoitia besnoiti]PFH37052.1 SAG-related sequence [Besnoitia besnoiti]
MATDGGRQQRRGGFKSKPRKWMAFFVGQLLLLLSGVASADLRRGGDMGRRASGDAVEDLRDTVECKVAPDPETAATSLAPVILSSTKLTTTLHCVAKGSTMIPTAPEKVCVTKQNATVKECATTSDDDNKHAVALKELLGETSEARWIEAQPVPPETGNAWTLKLKESDLPFADKSFFVGCQNSGSNQHCRVDVTVKARPSVVVDNVVTCAYGSESNSETLKVEITEEKSTLTIECGNDGSIVPTSYGTVYCGSDDLTSCEKSYSDILPNYAKTWWKEEGVQRDVATLTIPKQNFPAEDKQFYIGCSPMSVEGASKASGIAKGESERPAVPGVSVCKVLVTVKAAGSISSGESGLHIVGGASGAAVLIGLLAGSF